MTPHVSGDGCSRPGGLLVGRGAFGDALDRDDNLVEIFVCADLAVPAGEGSRPFRYRAVERRPMKNR